MYLYGVVVWLLTQGPSRSSPPSSARVSEPPLVALLTMSSDPALLWALGHSTTIASNTQSQGASASAAPGAGGYPPLQPGHAAIAPQPQAYSAPAPQPDYSAPPQADYAAHQQQTVPPGYLPPSYMPSASSAPLATATVGGAPVLPGYGGNVSVEVSGHQLMPPKPKQPKQAKQP